MHFETERKKPCIQRMKYARVNSTKRRTEIMRIFSQSQSNFIDFIIFYFYFIATMWCWHIYETVKMLRILHWFQSTEKLIDALDDNQPLRHLGCEKKNQLCTAMVYTFASFATKHNTYFNSSNKWNTLKTAKKN